MSRLSILVQSYLARHRKGETAPSRAPNAPGQLTRRAGLLLAIAVVATFSVPDGLSGGQPSYLAPASSPPSLQASAANASESEKNVDWTALLPEGEGRLQTSVYCTGCHGVKPIVADRRVDESGWKDITEKMVYSYNAPIIEEDVGTISHYLAQYFGPNVPKLELPVNVNSAPKELLQLLPGITPEIAEKLLEARKREKISDLGKLEAILGKEKADKLKSLVSLD